MLRDSRPYISILIILMAILQSCYRDKEELLYPNASICDTASVSTYKDHVYPIVKTRCIACHNSNNYKTLGGNLNLDSYAGIKPIAANGILLSSINHESGVSPMPQNSPKLSSCDILTIKRWIDDGYKDN